MGIAQDLDVSATTFDPFQRPELGGWLNNRSDEYDVIVFYRLDRFVRKVSHVDKMLTWSRDRGIRLKSSTEMIDSEDAYGEIFFYLVAIFAQMEANAISERQKAKQQHLRENGRYRGGNVPFGFQLVPHPEWGTVLEHDPEYAPILRQAIEDCIAGKSLRQIMLELNEAKVPTSMDIARGRAGKASKGSKWTTTTISNIFRSRILLGEVNHGGEVVRGKDGMPVRHAEPITPLFLWNKLQKAIAPAPKDKYRKNASLLLRVAYCGLCGRPFNLKKKSGRSLTDYYRCSGLLSKECDAPVVRADFMHSWVDDRILDHVGDFNVREKIEDPGEDHSEELERVVEAITELYDDRYLRGKFQSDAQVAQFDRIMANLESQRDHLASLPQRPSGVRYVETGKRYGDIWNAMDIGERNVWLREQGAVLKVHMEPGAKTPTIHANWGDLERVERLALGIEA